MRKVAIKFKFVQVNASLSSSDVFFYQRPYLHAEFNKIINLKRAA